ACAPIGPQSNGNRSPLCKMIGARTPVKIKNFSENSGGPRLEHLTSAEVTVIKHAIKHKLSLYVCASLLAAAALLIGSQSAQAQAQAQKPNILFIMGDDIGWMQPSIYHRGLMVGETPNIDKIGQEGALFTDYYAEQSCTAGRNAFFTGMHPLRTGMIPPQLPGSPSYLRPGFEISIGSQYKTLFGMGGAIA